MEGRPWLRILFILAGFALLGWPVRSLARPRQIAAPVTESPAGPAQPLRVEVSFADAGIKGGNMVLLLARKNTTMANKELASAFGSR